MKEIANLIKHLEKLNEELDLKLEYEYNRGFDDAIKLAIIILGDHRKELAENERYYKWIGDTRMITQEQFEKLRDTLNNFNNGRIR